MDKNVDYNANSPIGKRLISLVRIWEKELNI